MEKRPLTTDSPEERKVGRFEEVLDPTTRNSDAQLVVSDAHPIVSDILSDLLTPDNALVGVTSVELLSNQLLQLGIRQNKLVEDSNLNLVVLQNDQANNINSINVSLASVGSQIDRINDVISDKVASSMELAFAKFGEQFSLARNSFDKLEFTLANSQRAIETVSSNLLTFQKKVDVESTTFANSVQSKLSMLESSLNVLSEDTNKKVVYLADDSKLMLAKVNAKVDEMGKTLIASHEELRTKQNRQWDDARNVKWSPQRDNDASSYQRELLISSV